MCFFSFFQALSLNVYIFNKGSQVSQAATPVSVTKVGEVTGKGLGQHFACESSIQLGKDGAKKQGHPGSELDTPLGHQGAKGEGALVEANVEDFPELPSQKEKPKAEIK